MVDFSKMPRPGSEEWFERQRAREAREQADELEAEKRRTEAQEILDEITADDLSKLVGCGWDNAADFIEDMQHRLKLYGERFLCSEKQLEWLRTIKAKLEE